MMSRPEVPTRTSGPGVPTMVATLPWHLVTGAATAPLGKATTVVPSNVSSAS